jgi:hypothetical protein
MAVTKTLGPLHFEDLELKRFEEVRELIYEFKDWQRIEATGRSGFDDGFNICANERVSQPATEQEGGESGEEEGAPHPMEGNLWMFDSWVGYSCWSSFIAGSSCAVKDRVQSAGRSAMGMGANYRIRRPCAASRRR